MYSSRKPYKLPSAHHFLGIEGEEEFLLIGRGRRGEHFGPDDRVDRRGVDFGPAGAAGHRAAEDLAVRIKLYVDLHGKVRAGVGRHTPVRPHGKDDLPHIHVVDAAATGAVETLPTESDNMLLTVRKDGAIFLDSYEVGLDELQDKINLLVKQQNKQLFLQADKDVAYGLVVDVMGRIREAGIDKLGVVALREDTPAVPEKKGKK